MIKLIASDLDDTLLDRDSLISPENKRVIGLALARGLLFTIATGRMFQATLPYALELGLDQQQPLICYNGALIKRLSGETLYEQPLAPSSAAAIADYGQKQGWTVNAYYDDELYVAKWDQYVEDYSNFVGVEARVVGDLAAFILEGNRRLAKLLIVSDPEETDARLKSVQELAGSTVQIASSRKKFIEITSPEAHKGAALLWLAEFLGVHPAEVLAIGDSGNDQTMLQAAGIGVAVGNASAAVKAHADQETAPNYEAGVARAIEKFAFQDQLGDELSG